MKYLKRSNSSYHSCDKSKSLFYQRNYSVPYGFSYHEVDDNDIVDGVVPGQTLPPGVLECLLDAYGAFSEIYKAIIKPNKHFQTGPSDAVVLLPEIASLTQDNIPDALPTLYDVLMKIQQECPTLQQQNMLTTMRAVQNAMAILHTEGHDQTNLDIDLTQTMDLMAAAIIVDKYLTNLTHPLNSVSY